MQVPRSHFSLWESEPSGMAFRNESLYKTSTRLICIINIVISWYRQDTQLIQSIEGS